MPASPSATIGSAAKLDARRARATRRPAGRIEPQAAPGRRRRRAPVADEHDRDGAEHDRGQRRPRSRLSTLSAGELCADEQQVRRARAVALRVAVEQEQAACSRRPRGRSRRRDAPLEAGLEPPGGIGEQQVDGGREHERAADLADRVERRVVRRCPSCPANQENATATSRLPVRLSGPAMPGDQSDRREAPADQQDERRVRRVVRVLVRPEDQDEPSSAAQRSRRRRRPSQRRSALGRASPDQRGESAPPRARPSG